MNAQVRLGCVWLLVVAFTIVPVIGFSHSVIPHGHSHAGDTALHVAIAQGLESVLLRKDISVAIALLVIVLTACVARRETFGSRTQIHRAIGITALRKGIFPYRKFG